MVQQNGHGRLLGGATMIVAAAACVAIMAGAGFAWAQQPTAAAAPQVSGSMAPQFAAGAASYSQNCASCHGEQLVGPGAPELKGKAFLATWSGAPARRLYSRILSTMPLTDPGSLDPKTALDITTFILNENKQPVPAAGYASPAELDKISIRNGG